MLNDFVLTGFAFWGVVMFIFTTSVLCFTLQHPAPFLVALISTGILFLFGDWASGYQTVTVNWKIIGSAFIAYFIIGGLYSILKWWLFLGEPKQKQYLVKRYKSYVENYPSKATIENFKADGWANNLIPSNHYDKIVSWILLWPFSAAWTLSHNFIEHIYNSLLSVYTKISNSRISKTLGE